MKFNKCSFRKANFNQGIYKNLKLLFYSSCFYCNDKLMNEDLNGFKNIFINDDFIDHINWEFLIKYDKFVELIN